MFPVFTVVSQWWTLLGYENDKDMKMIWKQSIIVTTAIQSFVHSPPAAISREEYLEESKLNDNNKFISLTTH